MPGLARNPATLVSVQSRLLAPRKPPDSGFRRSDGLGTQFHYTGAAQVHSSLSKAYECSRLRKSLMAVMTMISSAW